MFNSLKILLLIGVNVCSVYAGFTISNSMKKRVIFYEGFISFFSELKHNLLIKKDDILSLLNSYEKNDDVKIFINSAIEKKQVQLEFISNKENLFFYNLIVKLTEFKSALEMKKFINEEIEMLQFDYRRVSDKYNLLSKNIIKLSLIIGLFVSIIFV